MWSKRRIKLSNLPRGSRNGRKRRGAHTLVWMLLGALVSSLCLSLFVIQRQLATTSNEAGIGLLRRTRHEAKDSSSEQHQRQQQDVDTAWPLIHIVNTRFMQEQGHLVTLARARLKLFETFCLPTMIHQTSQSFLWIIKTDAHLNVDIRNDMIALLKPHANYYLVGSNRNFNFGLEGGSWRDGSEGENVLQSPIYTGNIAWLKQAHALRDQRPILETRLDADDGIHKLFLQYVQYSASKYMFQQKWLYWCSRRHIEWYASPKKPEGLVNPVEHEKLCITPGITVGYSVGVNKVPQYHHDVLYKAIQANGGCHEEEGDNDNRNNNNNMDCIHLVDDLSFVAVRSRTPTSAGMLDTELQQEVMSTDSVKVMWKALDKLFFVSRQKATETNAFVMKYLPQIAKENLEGQCTTGHSCKNSSFVKLQKIIDENTVEEEKV